MTESNSKQDVHPAGCVCTQSWCSLGASDSLHSIFNCQVCTVIKYLGCAEIWIKSVVILPLLNLAGEQHLIVRSMDWHSSIRPVSASPHALLHMPSTNTRLSCNQIVLC